MQRALVTGAAGFIGHHVVRVLAERNDVQVRALIRPGEDTQNLEGLDIERVEGDIRDLDAMTRATKDCDHVFHLAAIYALWMREPQRMWDVNVVGTTNILNACIVNRVRRVVYTSSIAAVGLRPDTQVSDEQDVFNAWNEATDYVRTKYLSEQVALGYRDVLDIVIVNPSFPMGPGDVGPTPTGKMVLDFLRGDLPPLLIRGGISVVDVEDAARGHVLAAEHGRAGERYLLSGHNLTLSEIVDRLASMTGQQRRYYRVPAALLEGLGVVVTAVSNHITGREPLLEPRSIRYASHHSYFDNSKACRELGFSVRPVEETLQRAVDWFVAQGYVDR